MRHFHSYGPVDLHVHFGVERRELVERCVAQLVGRPDEPGHFFTIWAPRQAGKTWLMRRAVAEIKARHGDRFAVGALSMQALLKGDDGEEVFFKSVPTMFRDGFAMNVAPVADWNGWRALFGKEAGLFDRPLILLIDEFDALPPQVIDALVGEFRRIYLDRDGYWLHGLALVGVRAVLGVESPRGSPFNVQRSLHVPNLTQDEVREMFDQYQAESGQRVEPDVVDCVFEATRGQPGLVGWFGELLAEKYNRDPKAPITRESWELVHLYALQVEPNNTVLNLVKKARGPHRDRVMSLFGRADVPFSFDAEWSNYLYLNGIIAPEEVTNEHGQRQLVCRFSSPFVQRRLYNALTNDMFDPLPGMALPLDPLDALDDVFAGPELDTAALLQRYKAFLARLRSKGDDPWKDQPRRSDLHITEAVGHFHLYAWAQQAFRGYGSVSPEFPTWNGKVDLLVRSGGKEGMIEVKSFEARRSLPDAREQAARYATKRGLSSVAIALFVPSLDENVLTGLSGRETVGGVSVTTVAIGWAS